MRAHGTRAKYVAEKCRCEPCTAENRAYANRNNRERAMRAHGAAPEPYVDARAARKRLQQWADDGIGTRHAATLTGVARTVIVEVLAGRRTRIRPDVEARILARGVTPLAGGVRIPAHLTITRIRALHDHGWTWARIGQAIGMTATNAWALQTREQVTVRTAHAVGAAWREHNLRRAA